MSTGREPEIFSRTGWRTRRQEKARRQHPLEAHASRTIGQQGAEP